MFDKFFKTQVNFPITANVSTSPISGVNTTGDGVLFCGSGTYYSTLAGIGRTNFGTRHEPNFVYQVATDWSQLQYISFFGTSNVNVSLIIYSEIS